jgi:hypothetical protein
LAEGFFGTAFFSAALLAAALGEDLDAGLVEGLEGPPSARSMALSTSGIEAMPSTVFNAASRR